ncbi:hypothetical protein Tco_0173048 [Tanacetum coccineum]
MTRTLTLEDDPVLDNEERSRVKRKDMRQDTDALQGNVRTLVRGMKTHKTEIITAHNGVDRIRKRMDAFNVDIAFLEQATARVEDDVLALQARAETIEARQLQAEQDMTFWEF